MTKSDTKVIEELKETVAKLKEMHLNPEDYNICPDFAIYKGSLVDYKKIKTSFVQLVKEKIVDDDDKAFENATKIANFLNLGGFSSTRQNVVKIEEEYLNLDQIARKLNISNFTKTSTKTTDRSFITFTRVCVAFADDTRDFLKKFPLFSRIPDLADLGFYYSWACNNLTEKEVRDIFWQLLILEKNWTSTSRSNPRRFPEKMEFYYKTVKGYQKKFFDEIKEEFVKKFKPVILI